MSQTARVLRQRHWTEDELQKAGFHWFAPRKRLIMAQLVKVPTNIDASIETLLAEQGDINPAGRTGGHHLLRPR